MKETEFDIQVRNLLQGATEEVSPTVTLMPACTFRASSRSSKTTSILPSCTCAVPAA